MKKLIVNGDDFGLSIATNKGIKEAYQCGILTSATLLTNLRAFEDAACFIRKEHGLGAGIHLNLTLGEPVSSIEQVYQLVDSEGKFEADKKKWFLKFYFGKIDLKQIEVELNAQIRKFLDSGLKPTHIDTHHHIILFPKVYYIILELMDKYNISKLRFYRIGKTYFSDRLRWVKKTMVYLLGNKTRYSKFNSPDYIFDIEQVNLRKRLYQLKDGINEIFCHPGYVDDEIKKISRLTEKRKEELKQLIDPSVKKIIKELSIVLTDYSGF